MDWPDIYASGGARGLNLIWTLVGVLSPECLLGVILRSCQVRNSGGNYFLVSFCFITTKQFISTNDLKERELMILSTFSQRLAHSKARVTDETTQERLLGQA